MYAKESRPRSWSLTSWNEEICYDALYPSLHTGCLATGDETNEEPARENTVENLKGNFPARDLVFEEIERLGILSSILRSNDGRIQYRILRNLARFPLSVRFRIVEW